jgi:hypothetical protein
LSCWSRNGAPAQAALRSSRAARRAQEDDLAPAANPARRGRRTPRGRYRGEGVALGTGVRPALVGDGTGLGGTVAVGTGAAVGTATGVAVPAALVGTGRGTADGAAGPVEVGDAVGALGVGVAVPGAVAPLAGVPAAPVVPAVAAEAAALAP